MTCNSGYYHGVLQVALAGLPRNVVVKKSQRLCSAPAVNTEEFLLYQCVHGLGHGLMIYSGDDLPWSLRTCHKLLTDFDRVSCTGGVFMQNLDTTMGTSRYLKPEGPDLPVQRGRRAGQGLLLPDGHLEDQHARRLQLAQDRGLVPAQRAGLGGDVLRVVRARRLGLLRVRPGEDDRALPRRRARTQATASTAPRATTATTTPAVPEASRFCAASAGAVRPRCCEGIGTILGAMHRYGAERRRRASGRRRIATGADCYRGAAIT